jgi:hypothetical protein
MSDIDRFQRQADALLREDGPKAAFAAISAPQQPGKRFSLFVPEQADRARELATRFAQLADSAAGDAGLEAVLAQAALTSATESPDLVRHALMMFITHHNKGRNDLVPQRVRVVATQSPVTLGAALRPMLRHRRDLLDWSKLSFMESMSLLPAAPLPCYWPILSLWLGWPIR